MTGYVHGYDGLESVRLQDQARTLEDLLHADTRYPPGAAVLEAGCGVGAQTVPLARNSPGARITAIDVSAPSLARAKQAAAGLANVAFRQADLLDLPFATAAFDHVFLCFVLEHLREPEAALVALRRVLRPGGTITVIEGDHGSVLMHPDDPSARAAIACQVALQRRAGGDALIGRRLYPLLAASGFARPSVSPRMVYVDAGRPALVEGFIRRTFTAMVAGIRDQAIAAGLAMPAAFDAGIAALLRTTEPDGMFGYTFFKATAERP
jgi:SAM-dependent methyltransferase